jgi:thiamine biosynthesis lipoprotein
MARGEGAGTLSDVASKPVFIVGPAGWRQMAARMGINEALRLGKDGGIEATPAMAKRLAWVGGPDKQPP